MKGDLQCEICGGSGYVVIRICPDSLIPKASRGGTIVYKTRQVPPLESVEEDSKTLPGDKPRYVTAECHVKSRGIRLGIGELT